MIGIPGRTVCRQPFFRGRRKGCYQTGEDEVLRPAAGIAVREA